MKQAIAFLVLVTLLVGCKKDEVSKSDQSSILTPLHSISEFHTFVNGDSAYITKVSGEIRGIQTESFEAFNDTIIGGDTCSKFTRAYKYNTIYTGQTFAVALKDQVDVIGVYPNSHTHFFSPVYGRDSMRFLMYDHKSIYGGVYLYVPVTE